VKRVRVLHKVLDTRRDQASEALKTYAKESCLALCAKLHSTLPRELRDEVYAYVCTGDSVLVNSDWGTTSYFTTDPIAMGCYTHDRLSAAHYWKTEYIGNDILKEMAEVWYSKSTFTFSDCTVMERFLMEDRWNTGLSPGNLVRNICVSVNIASWAYTFTEHVQIQEDLKKELRKIMGLKKEAKIKIKVRTSYDHWNTPDYVVMKQACRDAFELTFPALYPLRDAGYQIIIAPDDHQDFPFEKAPFSPEDAIRKLVHVRQSYLLLPI
jgi:hypothetical protein